MSEPPIRVLVVDDSAFARKVVRDVLAGNEDIEVVGTARDGIDALEKIAALVPDVVTLDLVMPELDGVGVLRALKDGPKRPAVVIVSMTDQDGELGVAALALGAFDVVKKPTALATDRLYEIGDDLRAKIRAAGRRAAPRSVPPVSAAVGAKAASPGGNAPRILVIGTSTGGPQALTHLLRALPRSFPVPIAIVLHMPVGYTEAFARRLDVECDLEVMEARDGLVMRRGLAVVGRAGDHLKFEGGPSALTARLDLAPEGTAHRPSVSVMFESAAQNLGGDVLGVVLTGMGTDGLDGARAICAAGGRVLTETEASCVVYGMPRAVVEAGLSSAQAPLVGMAALILHYV